VRALSSRVDASPRASTSDVAHSLFGRVTEIWIAHTWLRRATRVNASVTRTHVTAGRAHEFGLEELGLDLERPELLGLDELHRGAERSQDARATAALLADLAQQRFLERLCPFDAAAGQVERVLLHERDASVRVEHHRVHARPLAVGRAVATPAELGRFQEARSLGAPPPERVSGA
jgi:hypothetical protein